MMKEHWLKHKRVATVAPVIVIIINPFNVELKYTLEKRDYTLMVVES